MDPRTTGQDVRWAVLECLSRGPAKARDVEDRAGQGRAVHTVLDRLVMDGLVLQGPDERYALTPKGINLLEARSASAGG